MKTCKERKVHGGAEGGSKVSDFDLKTRDKMKESVVALKRCFKELYSSIPYLDAPTQLGYVSRIHDGSERREDWHHHDTIRCYFTCIRAGAGANSALSFSDFQQNVILCYRNTIFS